MSPHTQRVLARLGLELYDRGGTPLARTCAMEIAIFLNRESATVAMKRRALGRRLKVREILVGVRDQEWPQA